MSETNIGGSSDNVDDLLIESGFSPEEWLVEKATVHNQKTKDGENHKQIWARVKRKDTAPFMDEEWRTSFLDKVKKLAPKNIELPKEDYQLASVINLSDAHLRMLSWHKETGVNYDLKIGAHVTRKSGLYLLEETVTKLGAEKVVLVIGNDMFHSDSQEPFTKRSGNLLDVDSRYQRGFEVAVEVITEIIDTAITKYNVPVEVIPIPGNHDDETVYFLGQYLHAYYYKQENVLIRNSPQRRKYFRWGKCLIGLSHGDGIKKTDVPNIMSKENPNISWEDCPFREMLFGHKHHEMSHDEKGTVIRWVNAIAPEDAYHYYKGYIGSVKGSQAFMYDKNIGLKNITYYRVNYPIDEAI